ncbi:EF-hand calcium-binding domain-containing protein 4B isoform X2 [Neoarius graeffei]|uniref:EF-hand calcium-binding domain-containing protein 4B isoform X2 n=1 Tax=Neoarius graeffei TaxID=443677 RepID=UPI00298BFABA|nr:EF-hand calcium-binding domain-containing protein 4B isoform X2 [Neoarius graeffei]
MPRRSDAVIHELIHVRKETGDLTHRRIPIAHKDTMAAFSSTCDSQVSRASRLRGKDTKSKSSVCGSPLELSDCSTVLEKSQEFFQICDTEDKGFVTRRDMQRLLGELPLSAEELENVFDTLDADGNGYLTPEEFSSGFSEFIFGPAVSAVTPQPAPERVKEPISPDMLYQSQWENKLSVSEDDEEQHFCILMESLGASSVFEDPGAVQSLWAQLRKDEPRLLANFEEFLARVTYQIKEANQEKSEMETALKRKAASHDDEIQRLYEEMEQQIKNEKDRILLQDSERFLTFSQDLEYQLSSKERELELLSNKQKRLEQQCHELHSEQRVTAVENVKLKQYNQELAHELEHTTQELSLAQEQLSLLQEQASRLQEERELEVYRVTEGLQRERANLLKQLDLLREMNKHLRDEQDVHHQKPNNLALKASRAQRSGYTERKQSFKIDDDEDILPHSKRKSAVGVKAHSLALGQDDQTEGWRSPKHQLQRIISIEEDHLPQLLQKEYQAELRNWSEEEEDLEEGIDLQTTSIFPSTSTPIAQCPPIESRRAHTPTSPRGQPVGKETVQLEGASSEPDRLFKIVLVGNSSVGKTSLLRRFCDGCFYPGTSATVGIDYSVKTLIVDNSQVALQMWDTAGQERYRSITKQFFRKADGVVVMYDITSEQTFTAVRSWLDSVQEGAGDDIPVMLLGNKTDLEDQREIQFRVAEKLAKEFRLNFFECSAFSGHNVTESMVHLSRILKEQEDREKEKTVSLVDAPSKKKACC